MTSWTTTTASSPPSRGEGLDGPRRPECNGAGGTPMNLNHNPTLQQLRDLIRVADDNSGGHLLWVRRDGEVMLTPLKDRGHPPRFEVKPEMQMCCEPFWAGN